MPALLLLFGIFGLAILPHVFLAILEFLRQCVSSLFLASHDDDPVIEAWLRHALANTLRYGGVAVAALAYSLSCDAEGAERMRVHPDGRLVFDTALGEVFQTPPISWCVRPDGSRIPELTSWSIASPAKRCSRSASPISTSDSSSSPGPSESSRSRRPA